MKHSFFNSLSLAVMGLFLIGCADEDSNGLNMQPLNPTDGSCITIGDNFNEFLELPPVGDNGSYDPTLAGDPTTGKVWMIFSRVDGRGGEGKVSTHLAVSEDAGATWCYVNQINVSEDVPLDQLPSEFDGKAVSAHWSHEVPSIAYLPEAPADQRWRILWHRYLHVNDGLPGNDDRAFAYGWIATKTASSPELLADKPEEKLFSALGYYKDAETESYNNMFVGTPDILLHELHPDLSTAVVITEPGMQSLDGNLYVSFVAGNPTLGNSVVLIKQDQSQKWSYVSTLLTPQDASEMNPSWTNFSASDLSFQSPQGYLIVSPVNEIYLGAIMFKLDLTSGTLIDSDGNGPDVVWEIPRSNVPGIIQTGVATYDPMSVNTGIIFGDAVEEEPQFLLYATGVIPE